MIFLKIIVKLNRICGWLLIPLMILLFITGYAMVGKYYCNKIIEPNFAYKIHSVIMIPTLVCFVLHTSFGIFFFIKRLRAKIKRERLNKK